MKLKSLSKKDRYGNMFSVEFDTSVPEMSLIPNHPGEPKGTDTVPAWLTPGEFVMNAESVRMFEPQIEAMNDAGRAVQKQQGGTIPQYKAEGGLLDRLVNMFSSDDEVPRLPDATMGAVPPAVDARAGRVDELSKAMFPQGATRPDPKVSNEILMNLLKDKEGFRDKAYLDSAGIPTIGYGFTEGVQMGDTMDENIANKRLLQEMARTDEDYNKLVTADLNPNQEAAVKSLLYNIGGPQFANSKARAALNAGDFDTFKKEASEFRMADGKVVPGLENRRRDELELFFKPYNPSKNDFDNTSVSKKVGTLLNNDVYEDDMGEFINTPEGPVYLDSNQLQAMTRNKPSVETDDIKQANEFEGLGNVPPINAPEVDSKNKFDTNGDGVLSKEELLAARNSAMSSLEKPTTLGASTPMNIMPSGGQIVIDSPDTLISRNEQILNDMIAANAKPEDIKQQSNKLKIIKNIQPRQEAFSDVVKAQSKVEKVDETIENLTTKIERLRDAGLNDEADALVPQLSSAISEKDKLQPELDAANKQQDDLYTTATLPDGTTIPNVGKVAASVLEDDPSVSEIENYDENMDQDKEQDLAYVMSGKVPPTNAPPLSKTDTNKDGTTTAEEIVNNKEFPDDGTTKGQTETNATSEGNKPENKDNVNTATSFFKDIFGDLYDSGELKRMAIMYVGSRALGGSHNGSLNFAAKAYVKRVDAKVDAHNKYVKDLYKGGKHTSKSLDKFRKSKNLADLELKGATYAPTGGAPITKMVPQFNKKGDIIGYTKETLVPVKSSADDGTYYQTASGSVIHPSRFASLSDYREELDDNTEAYKQRRSRILGDMEGYFSEIRDGSPDNYTEEDGKRTYLVGVGPKQAALAYYDWAKRQGVDPDSTAGRKVMNQAYENMVIEAKSKGIKFTPNDFTRYLEAQQIRETTGAPELFITNMDKVTDKKAAPEYVRADKMDLLYQNLDTVISKIPGSTARRGDIMGIAIRKWNNLDKTDDGRALKEKYESSAIGSKGESGFYKYMMDTAEALHAELNKPKE